MQVEGSNLFWEENVKLVRLLIFACLRGNSKEDDH